MGSGTFFLKAGITLFIVLAFIAPAHALEWGTKELRNEEVAIKFAREVERGHYSIVSTKEMKKWIDQKKPMLVIDTMPYEDSYKKQHLPGAKQIEFPIPEMKEIDEKKKKEFIKLLGPDKDKLIVVYCGFTKCTRSHNGAMWAVKLGYKNIYRYPGGIKAWMQADYPVEQVK
jgi:rhodanese-related sulfurtransferase